MADPHKNEKTFLINAVILKLTGNFVRNEIIDAIQLFCYKFGNSSAGFGNQNNEYLLVL